MISGLRKEVREASPFTIAINSIKYLRIALTKQMKALYAKNCISLKTENVESHRKWKMFHVPQKVELAILTKTISDSMHCPLSFQQNSSWTVKEKYSNSNGIA